MKDLDYSKGYTYDHDSEEGFIPKQGLPDALAGRRFYFPTAAGREARMKERLEELDKRRTKGE